MDFVCHLIFKAVKIKIFEFLLYSVVSDNFQIFRYEPIEKSEKCFFRLRTFFESISQGFSEREMTGNGFLTRRGIDHKRVTLFALIERTSVKIPLLRRMMRSVALPLFPLTSHAYHFLKNPTRSQRRSASSTSRSEEFIRFISFSDLKTGSPTFASRKRSGGGSVPRKFDRSFLTSRRIKRSPHSLSSPL